tara:strand:+ start:1008 stop:1181 length:174 start_codon:yes stop_codon:yes gene_type:complete
MEKIDKKNEILSINNSETNTTLFISLIINDMNINKRKSNANKSKIVFIKIPRKTLQL